MFIPTIFFILGLVTFLIFYFQKTLFNIPPYIPESVAVGILSFYFGYIQEIRFLILFLISFIFIVILDPFIWSLFIKDEKPSYETLKTSFTLNGTLLLIGIFYYIVGAYV